MSARVRSVKVLHEADGSRMILQRKDFDRSSRATWFVVSREPRFTRAGLFLLLALFSISNETLFSDESARRAAESIHAGVPAFKRQLAVDMLTGIGAEALPVVRELALAKEPIQRMAALEVMGNLGVDAEIYLAFLGDPSYHVRKAALEGIQNAETGLDEPAPLLVMLEDPFWPVRCAAIRALAAWAEPGLAGRFLKMLDDTDPRVRRSVLQCMDRLCDDIPADALEEAVRKLSARELRRFMEACVPLVRECNVAFFQARAHSHRDLHIRTAARFICAAHTRKVPEAWLPDLVDQALEGSKEVADAATTLLTWAGDAVAGQFYSRLDDDDKPVPDPRVLIMLFTYALGDEAVPHLAAWIEDEGLSEQARSACLDGLLSIDSAISVERFAHMAPVLGDAFKKQVIDQALSLAGGRQGNGFAPFFISILKGPDAALSQRAFLGLCYLPDPPVDELIRIFTDEHDPSKRRFFASNLVKVADGAWKNPVARCLLDELAASGPAALDAACALPSIVVPELRDQAVVRIHDLLASCKDRKEQKRLAFALLELDPEGADQILADHLARAFEAGRLRDAEFLVAHLDRCKGASTAQAIYRIFPDAQAQLKEEIVRTLIRRADPEVIPWIHDVFASASIFYRRAVVNDMAAAPELARAWEGSLKKILHQERDGDLLSAAIAASPRSLLEAEEDRLLALAELGAELGMEAIDALFHAMASLGTKQSLDYLRGLPSSFIEETLEDGSPAKMETAEAGLAETAVLSLASVKDEVAVPLLARMLFLHAHLCRESHIVELWSSGSVGRSSGASHKEARAMLRGLLCYDDSVAEPLVLRELDVWAKNGALIQCGDAAFCTIFRELTQDPGKRGRFPILAQRLSELTLTCAPAHSPSDFRVHRLRAVEADAHHDPARAAEALKKACHVLKFYPPARKVLRDVVSDPDRFRGNDLYSVLMSDRYLCEAAVHEQEGKAGLAEEARKRAKQHCPFRETIQGQR